jgi:hypothetical protein
MKDEIKPIRGVVEVSKHDAEGNLIQHFVGENTVMRWAKHALMHMMVGEPFSAHGKQRDLTTATGGTSHTTSANADGTMISGDQYFSTNTNLLMSGGTLPSGPFFPSQTSNFTLLGTDADTPVGLIHPFYPTKLLLGTGFEFKSGQMTNVSTDVYGAPFYTYYKANNSSVAAWTDSELGTISEPSGTVSPYSAYYSAGVQVAKTMNDISSRDLSGFAFPQEAALNAPDGAWAVPGAIKNGGYRDSSLSATYLSQDGNGNYFLKNIYSGLGDPAFIYAKKAARFFGSGSETLLEQSTYLTTAMETQLTFSFTLPAQTGTDVGKFYPYNGFTLKVAGLFCDARFTLGNDVSLGGDPYASMPHGMMLARRSIPAFTKTHDTSISVKWTLYI